MNNIFNKEWILSQEFIQQEDDDGNLTFSKLVEDSEFWIYLPKYFVDIKSQYLSLWWKNTSLKIKSEIEYKKFYSYIQLSDVELPRNGPSELKFKVLGLFDSLNKKYKKESIELKVINYDNRTFENIQIDSYKTTSKIKKEKIFIWIEVNSKFQWKEIINYKNFGFVLKPIDEIQEIKLKLLKYENSNHENLFENSFIGIFSDLEIFNSSRWKYSIGNLEKTGTVIYKTDTAQFSITDDNSNLKYAISAVKFLEKL